MIVSLPQLETAETVTVYLCLPVEQLVTLPKTPTLSPGEDILVLNVGAVTTAHAELPVEPPPPFPFCADIGSDTSARQTNARTLLVM